MKTAKKEGEEVPLFSYIFVNKITKLLKTVKPKSQVITFYPLTLSRRYSATAGETVLLIAPELAGQKTGVLAFGEKIRAGRIVPDMSSFRQKYIGTTYGGIVLQPYAFASMTGM